MNRTAWILAFAFVGIAALGLLSFSGGLVGGSRISIGLSPREEDGSQLAVDFIHDLAKGRTDSAWERTAVVFQEERDYDSFAEQARRYFGNNIWISLKAGDEP